MAGNLSGSYEKIVLVLSIVIALGLGALFYLNAGKVEKDFAESGGGRAAVPKMKDEETIKSVAAQVGTGITVPTGTTADGRPVNLFVGVPWFMRDGQEQPVDLGDASNAPVHPPIPNEWWLEHRIDPGFADSPDRDHDNDGFTNLEEYEGKTDPTDFKSHPSLVAKLRVAKLDKSLFKVTYTSDTAAGALAADTTYKFRYTDVFAGRLRNINSDYLPAGQGAASSFFSEGPAQLRFELKKVEQRQVVNQRNGLEETLNFATIEDLSPAKKGDVHEIEKGSKTPIIITDYTAVLFLDAIGQAGNEVPVAERSRFSLPLDPDAPEADKLYLFKGVTEAGEVEIEYTAGGQTETLYLEPNS